MDTFKSLLILGRQPALGLAELESVFGASDVSLAGTNAALIQHEVTAREFARLGGSLKLARVVRILQNASRKDTEKYLFDSLPTDLQLSGSGKLQLGLSSYGLSISPQKLLATGLSLKKILANQTGRSVRLVSSKDELHLSSPQVIHNGLLSGGCEIVLVQSGHDVIVARTVAEQDIESYARRDQGRPKRDAKVGMLPPKLAQIIINLAAGETTSDNRTLLDPFCGTGVVLQEALLTGYDVYGTDLEPRMIDYTGENLDWLDEQFDLAGRQMRIEDGDATVHHWEPAPDLVACETYLGRPFTALPSPEILQQTISECNLIIKKFLRNIHTQIKPGTRLCVAVPAWQTAQNTFRHLPLIDQISDLSYNRVSFEHVLDSQLLYYREDQIVARELLVLTRN
jgi:tRNA (guanine10-N2)-dimethyltransferase